jgi:hypothetical protein
MIFCARATRGRRLPSPGLMARPGVPVGGRVRKSRAVEDQSAPIPEESTSKLGGKGWVAWSSSCSRNAHDKNVLVQRAHSRINQATLEKEVWDLEDTRRVPSALPVWPVSLVPHVTHVSRQRNYARRKGQPRPLPSLSSPTHLIPTAKIECVGFLSKTWRKAGRFQAEIWRLSRINSVDCLHRQFSVSSLEWAHAVRVGS